MTCSCKCSQVGAEGPVSTRPDKADVSMGRARARALQATTACSSCAAACDRRAASERDCGAERGDVVEV